MTQTSVEHQIRGRVSGLSSDWRDCTPQARMLYDGTHFRAEVVVPLAFSRDLPLGTEVELVPLETSTGSRNVAGPRAVDVALRRVEQAVEAAVAEGAAPSTVLGRVANGLTGRVNGPIERAATSAMTAAYEEAIRS